MDASDNLFAVQAQSRAKESGLGFIRTITKYTPTGTLLRRYGYGAIEANVQGLAARHTASGDVYLSEAINGALGNKVKLLAEPPPGPLLVPKSVEASPVGNTKATLNAEINPEGKATEYQFEYVDQKSFETEGGFASSNTKSVPEAPEEVPIESGTPEEEEKDSFKLHYVNALAGCAKATKALIEAGKCLSPETTYRFKVEASNADGVGIGPIEGSFTTKAPLEIQEPIWASEVGTDSARIHAEVNPLGIAATGFFEVVDDAHFQESEFAEAIQVPDVEGGQAPLSFGDGEAFTARSALLSSLPPNTAFHYRFLATDEAISPTTFASQPRAFTTFRSPATEPCPNDAFRIGPGARLPDCRAYEMVSPLDKGGGDIKPLGEATTNLPAVLEQSSLDGDKLAYGTYRAFGDAQSAPFTSQYLAARGSEGWVSHGISPPQGRQAGEVTGRLDTEFKLFSADLCEGWLRYTGAEPLEEDGVPGFFNLYRRTDEECGGPTYEALTTIKPPHGVRGLELQGASTDGGAAIYALLDSLAVAGPKPPAQPGGCDAIGLSCNLELYYRKAGGVIRFVCILPSGTAIASGGCAAGTYAGDNGQARRNSLHHALSGDGSKVFWSDSPTGPGKIYLRTNPGEAQSTFSVGVCNQPIKACTVPVSEEAEEATGTGSSQFWTAAEDGSRAIFTTGKSLYEYDTAEAKDRLIAKKVLGVAGASTDAKWLYFASEEVLTVGANPQGLAPTAGKANLYLAHQGGFSFVATLASTELSSAPLSPISSQPMKNTTHVAPDGQHVAFMTQASPFGYDNADAASGKADAEVYLYDATANAGAGKLACASCNPSGARPAGSDIVEGLGEFWAGAQLPVWENTLYQARVLSEDGTRLYFESTDTLSVRDTNGVGDVYQWEAPGAGGCEESDFDYFPANEGCLSLVSSGESERDSEFVDASPTGNDVFFSTLASLLPQDFGLVDIYDARVEGGLPTPPTPPAHCEGEACQNPAPAPEFVPGASSSYEGPGNVAEPPYKPKCPKGKVRKNGHCVKKHAKKKATKHKRAGGRQR